MIRIQPENIDLFCHTNKAVLEGPIRAVALQFHGLNFSGMPSEIGEQEARLASRGILTVMPYDDPWSWMNDRAVAMTDEVVAALYARHALDSAVPLISAGGSMGGLSALIYARYARKTPVACAANCPVCDLPFHATERPDLPRTIYAAYMDAPDGLEEAIRAHSPLHQAAAMPRIPYYIVHGEADTAVNLRAHSMPFVKSMRDWGHDVEFVTVPGMTHCDLKHHPEAEAGYLAFIERFAG